MTLLNKAAFASVDFHYPYFLSSVHMICNSIGSQLVFYWMRRRPSNSNNNNNNSSSSINNKEQRAAAATTTTWLQQLLGNVQRQSLDRKGQRLILAFSVIFSLNIAIGNVSLRHVSVNFNQVMRSLVPAVTILIGKMVLGKQFSLQRQLAVLPVVIGVAMACFGDMSYTWLGFLYTTACVLLAALKVVASGEMLTGALKLHPIDLLGHMAPLALVQCIALSFVTGEIRDIAARWETELSPTAVSAYPMFVVWLSGILSFSLNICSLQANKLTSPLTLCIAANVKQVLMIAASTVMFGTYISPLNGAGIVVVLMGSSFYSYVSVLEKTTSSSAAFKVDTDKAEADHNDLALEEEDVEVGSGSYTDETVELLKQRSSTSPSPAKRAVPR